MNAMIMANQLIHQNVLENHLNWYVNFLSITLIILSFLRITSVKNSTMVSYLINLKMVEFFVKISFDYLRKGFFFPFFFVLKFINIFKSRANADYYSSIKDPIDLTQIQQKIHSDEYSSFEQFLDDIELLLNNAKNFYRVKIKICILKNRIFFFYFRKILLNGKMLMNYQNIFLQKPILNRLILIISKNFLQLFIMHKLMIVL